MEKEQNGKQHPKKDLIKRIAVLEIAGITLDGEVINEQMKGVLAVKDENLNVEQKKNQEQTEACSKREKMGIFKQSTRFEQKNRQCEHVNS
ncbi:uncharacterized protein MONOS_3332 [Monocercomonoides exilis]|uniref:uncharacterized protein n=1 Tax=Monocercomonoides exilis TaxID=2049356 RepID=UPI003559BBFF|nr:hypothetical protein MONOS_3332 [Monocercomonoides exilis]|eukprot:MONOS_3332.1-p1 / transcript=MONOS_3332.1 / gene=MONOS_3332 / organism=Monocercomonoides_exilis_PA203 / gene_product=unspecified product / transcript_product=unspecified product / location=Mono_scaffold00077:114565-114837(-) / protein_length=91 / sequence_SO=supercontig / SO=protein_coding / is_pseudo=false